MSDLIGSDCISLALNSEIQMNTSKDVRVRYFTRISVTDAIALNKTTIYLSTE